MSGRLIVRRSAKRDMEKAFTWYQKQRSGLGHEAIEAVEATLHEVASRPMTFQIKYEPEIRAAYVTRFPYVVFFVDGPRNVAILGIIHTSRDHVRFLRRRR